MMAFNCNGAIVMMPMDMESYAMWAEPKPDIFRKTKMCMFFQQGNCQRGAACAFAHGDVELNPLPDLSKTKLCPNMNKAGKCPRGDECMFAHSEAELRQYVDHQTDLHAAYQAQFCNPLCYNGEVGLPLPAYYMEPYIGEEAVAEEMKEALRKYQQGEDLSSTEVRSSSEEQTSRSISDDDQEAPVWTEMKARQERPVRPVAKLLEWPSSGGSTKPLCIEPSRQFSRSTVADSNSSDAEQDGTVRWCDLASDDEDEGWESGWTTKGEVKQCQNEMDITADSPCLGA